MSKVLLCFQEMNIAIGDSIVEPIAILCHGPPNSKVWSGMVKVHLQKPKIDGKTLLHGTKAFALLLDK